LKKFENLKFEKNSKIEKIRSQVYNEALIVSELLRTADARDFIHDELFGHHSNSETDQKMKSLYDKSGEVY